MCNCYPRHLLNHSGELHLPECTASFLLAEKEAHIHYRLCTGEAQCEAALTLHENINPELVLTCPFNFSLSLSLPHPHVPPPVAAPCFLSCHVRSTDALQWRSRSAKLESVTPIPD